MPDDPIVDRALGCLLGLAVGDALGTTLEFARRDARPPLNDMIGGGPFGLEPGEWTDDTSMALCLADSLIACGGLDQRDLMARFVRWWREGYNSHNGRCFDIGITTQQALRHFLRNGNPVAGSTDPNAAGNGSIMRLAPVVLRWAHDPEQAVAAARRQSPTTHGAAAAVEGGAVLAEVLADAIATGDKAAALRPRRSSESTIDAVARGGWRAKPRDAIRSSGYVVHTLEAALWCVDQAADFPEAVRFFNGLLTDKTERSAYFEAALSHLAKAELIFFDPDNGIAPNPSAKLPRRSSKFVYPDEIAAAYDRQHSVLIYQHFPRVPRDLFIDGLGAALAQRAPNASLWCFRTPFAAFLLLVHPNHADRLVAAAKSAPERWRPRFIDGQPLSSDAGG